MKITLLLALIAFAKPPVRAGRAPDACFEAVPRKIPADLAHEMENGNNLMTDASFCKKDTKGCSLEQLLPKGVIERLGLREGDVLLRTEKGAILNILEALNALSQVGRGEVHCVRLEREGRELSLRYTLEPAPRKP